MCGMHWVVGVVVLSFVVSVGAGCGSEIALVVDSSAIRKIEMTTLAVSTVAGSTTRGSDDGIGTNAMFNGLYYGLKIAPNSQFALVADAGNGYRKIKFLDFSVTTLLPFSTAGPFAFSADSTFVVWASYMQYTNIQYLSTRLG